MGLPDFSVKRPVTTFMIFLGIALIGLVAMSRLPVELMPNVSFGDITIIVNVRGGIPPEEIEERVTKPIEETLGTVTHLKNILSISKEGNSTVILEFEPGTNMDFAALEVREQFARIRGKLPPEIEKPVIAKYEYLDVPIIILAVTGKGRTPEMLRRIVDDTIKERIARTEGVARVEVAGGRERKILVEVDQSRLQAYRLPITQIVDILNLSNLNLLAGDIKRAKDKYLVRAIGEFQNLDEIREIGIAKSPQGSIIRLKDVAEVKDSYLEPSGFARMNLQPVVSLYVQKESTANTVRVAKGIQKELKRLRPELSEDIEITPTFNQADFVKKAVDTVKTALLYGAVLAVTVLMVFLKDLRSTFIIALTIPIAVLATFSLMYFQRVSLNVMTLSGLALGVGMLVDNSIVVLENIFKKREKTVHSSPRKASQRGRQFTPYSFATGQAVHSQNQELETERSKDRVLATEGAREMMLAIVASTITTVVVFLPIIFVNKEIRMLYSGLALTVTFSLTASLLIALTLVPMLASRILTKRVVNHPANQPREELVERSQGHLSKVEFEKTEGQKDNQSAMPPPRVPFLERAKDGYRKSLAFIIRFRYPVIICAFLIFAQAIHLGSKLEKEFMGIAEQNKFTIFIEMPTGTRLEVTDQIVSQVEKLVSPIPEVKTVTAKIEPWSSKLYIELLPVNKRKRSTSEVIEALRPQVDYLQPPAFIYFEEPQEVGTKEILLEIYGFDYEVLKQLAISVARRLEPIEKLTDVKIRMREGRPEIRLLIDKKKAALFGLSVREIATVIHTQMRGLVATRYHSSEEPLIRMKRQSKRASLETVRFAPESLGQKDDELIDKKLEDFRAIHYVGQREIGEPKEIETITRLEEKFRRRFDDLHQLTLITPWGTQVSLEQISRFKGERQRVLGPSEIWRKNKKRMVQVSANTGGMALGTAAQKIKEALSGLRFPENYLYQFGGNYQKMIENQRQLTFALWLTLILIFMVLASLFESYRQPLIIMISVPLALIGAVGALTLTRKPIGIGVLIGAIMLVGIVVNNAIILVDRINRCRRDFGRTRSAVIRAVVTGSAERLRPILMTTSTTVLGLLPLALDKSEAANLWSPLAITVIGGLAISTLLTLFIVPSIYVIFEDLPSRSYSRIRR